MSEEGIKNFSAQTVTSLIGSEKSFITNKLEVDIGKVQEVTVGQTGAVLKVVIQGAKKATVTMNQVYGTLEDALSAAKVEKEKIVQELNNDIAALVARINNVREEGL